jgi:3-oxoacyl-[acyl-carrier protein] reductase
VNREIQAALRTPLFDRVTPARIDFMLSGIPIGRCGTVEEVAALLGWPCSDEASFWTAAVFDCPGGRATY